MAGARRGLVALAGLTLVAAGCGGGMSHKSYVAHADAVCTAYRAQANGLKNAKHYADVVAYVNHDLPLYEAALQKLAALEPPKSDRSASQRWLAADRRVAAAVRELGLAAQRHDFPRVSDAAAKVQQAEIESRRAAGEIGFGVCGSLVTGR